MSDINSDGEDDILLFPITDIDDSAVETSQSEAEGHGSSGSEADEESQEIRPKPQMPLRERRIKRAYSIAKPIKSLDVSRWVSVRKNIVLCVLSNTR